MNDLFNTEVTGNSQSELITFHFDGAEVRIVEDENNDPWFVAKDVCAYFGDTDHKRSISRIDDDEKMIVPVADRMGRIQQATAVNESGLYSLLFNFQPEKAPLKDGGAHISLHIEERVKKIREFRRWVTHEVLPSIRKTGGYIRTTPEDTPEMIMAKALKVADATMKRQQEELRQARSTIAQKDEQLELAAPKVAFVDTLVACTKGNILVRDFAKMVSQSLGLHGFGQNVVFDWLKKHGYMNLNRYPSQKAKDMKLLELNIGMHQHHDGTSGEHHCSRITPKRQVYFYEKIKAQYDEQGRWW